MSGQNTITFTEDNFNQEVLKCDVPVLVDFWAEWCGPCKALGPKIDELADETTGKFKIGKVNVDENPNLTSQCGVSAFPTLLVYKNGEIVDRMIGLKSKTDIEAALDQAAN